MRHNALRDLLYDQLIVSRMLGSTCPLQPLQEHAGLSVAGLVYATARGAAYEESAGHCGPGRPNQTQAM